ncbi:MAG: bifunctional diaminohydroxyphosphoribosylaminopyrimidine deaminase/5-amino-6-(5-phosphoribosylamino)uracil reductase RibD [Armatimonadota bacterium]|nr:bifunctional diaminohydroxyphosphoribosylaminopyrimidine deaminase/5-amino-6-(5-phosphoribosylamino)uracil reductase RibD [Armatimonadota bacterium]
MKRALRLAKRGHPSPNPMVGAVVVCEGRIVGEGFHPKAGEPHAEVFALRNAGDLAKGADLYVSLEPCCHQGRTPPCTDAIIEAGIRRVFAAMVDPNPQVAGKGIETLKSAGIEVEVGLLESEASDINRGYVKRITQGLPFVLWKCAMTLDGKICTRTGDSRWITSEKARQYVHRLRSQSDAIVVGIGTIRADDPELTSRGVRSAVQPIRVVVDTKASIPLNSKVLKPDAPTIVAVGRSAPEANLDALWNMGVKILSIQEIDGKVALRYLMGELAKMGVNNVLLEGGGEIAASMISERLVDRGLIFIAPKIVGGRLAKTPVEGEGIELMSRALQVSKLKVRRFGNDLALEFDLNPN